jgi:hypothetical protein
MELPRFSGDPLPRTRPDTGPSLLVNVCYRLYAQAEFAGRHHGTTWPPHANDDVFDRAVERGQWFYTPCLGWKELPPGWALCYRSHGVGKTSRGAK